MVGMRRLTSIAGQYQQIYEIQTPGVCHPHWLLVSGLVSQLGIIPEIEEDLLASNCKLNINMKDEEWGVSW